ncbi:MAG: protein kinase [Betaproteobacteria bacterium]
MLREGSHEMADVLGRRPQLTALLGEALDASDPMGLAEGGTVGPYRLLRELGAGGMGVVWLAERTDGLVKRPVALKLPLLALQRGVLAERFARERDILASLEHPNIARLYDAGTTPTGQPFLALEYVEGKPITQYCDDARLGVRARIGLLIQVLRAVQYAHAHLVIHRDLKPSNILVTPDGEVRLLDFGVAKLIGDAGAGQTELTRNAGPAHTPSYASPEQIAGGAVNIASDVYSLGVLGYELLAGVRPHRLRGEGRGEVDESILHADPPRPSVAATSEAADRRGLTSTKRLAALLSGDLDTILLKALKKRPEQRYHTVDALTEDLERHLRGDAIEARADSAFYRAHRLVARHRVAFGAVVTIATTLIAGTTVALWQAREARREAARASAVQQFVVDLFRANTADQADPLRARQTTARELLDRGAARIADSLVDQPESRLALLETLGGLYGELGMWAEASDLSAQQLALARKVHGEQSDRLVDAIIWHARALDGRDGTAPERIAALLDEAERILDARGDQASLARARLHATAAEYYVQRSIDRARQHAARAVEVYRNRYPDDSGHPDALETLANVMLRQGEWALAQATIDEALAVARRQKLSPYRMLNYLRRAGEINAFAKQVEKADELLREGLALSERVNGPRHRATNSIRRALFRHLAWTARTEEADRLAASAIADVLASEGGRESYQVQETRRQLFDVYWARGRLRASGAIIADAFDAFGTQTAQTFERADLLLERGMIETVLGAYAKARTSIAAAAAIAEHLQMPRTSLLRGNLALFEGELRFVSGDVRGAKALLEEQLRYWEPGPAGMTVERVMTLAILAEVHLAAGEPEAAARAARDAEETIAAAPNRAYLTEADARVQSVQARILMAPSRCDAALPYLDRATELYARVHAAESPWRANAEVLRATCLIRLGRVAEASPLLAQARAVIESYPQLGTQFTAPLGRALALADSARRGVNRPRGRR